MFLYVYDTHTRERYFELPKMGAMTSVDRQRRTLLLQDPYWSPSFWTLPIETIKSFGDSYMLLKSYRDACTCTCIYTYTCIYIYMCVYVCMYACMYVCMYAERKASDARIYPNAFRRLRHWQHMPQYTLLSRSLNPNTKPYTQPYAAQIHQSCYPDSAFTRQP